MPIPARRSSGPVAPRAVRWSSPRRAPPSSSTGVPGDHARRPVTITLGWQRTAFASALVELGDTKVVCAVSREDRVPPFLRGGGKGWVTAEYSMLPGATSERSAREAAKGRPGGRTHEIQRLIGRALRAVTDA